MDNLAPALPATTDYLTLVLSFSGRLNNYTALLSLFFLTMGRLLPIIIMSPFFGAKISPHPMKMVLGISLFAILLPQLIQVTTTPLTFDVWLLFLLAKELFIGLAIGVMVNAPFFVIQNMGIIVDNQRGGASLLVMDPAIQNQSSPFGTLFNQMLIVIFYLMGGPFLLIEAISYSYDVLPPDRLLSARFFVADTPFWHTQFTLFNKIMVMSIQFAAPALIMILMTDCFLGIANRLAPQVQVTFLGMPLKSFLAIMVLWLGLETLSNRFVIDMRIYLQAITEMIRGFGI